MVNYIKLVLAAALICGCYTEKKAQKQVDKAIKQKPKIAAETLRKAFPCITKIDTVVKVDTGYDFIEIQCPDQIEPVTKIDTIVINKVTKNKVYLPGKIVKVGAQKETITITKLVRDSAEIYLLNKQIKDLTDGRIVDHQKIKNRNKWILWLLVALVISLLFNFIKFNRK